MPSEIKVTDNILTATLNKWGNKKWFQCLFIGVVIYLLISPTLGTVVSSFIQKERTTSAISETLDARDKKMKENHVESFIQSRQTYTMIKREMNSYVPKIKCDYLFLLEFHNGTENAITGIQFCKFDLTLECTSERAQYIQLEKFRDDIVARYDVLLQDEFNQNDFILVDQQDFEKIDKYLAYQVKSINANSYAILNLKDSENRVFGALVCLTTSEEPMNITELHKLADRLEKICVKNKPFDHE